jgi:hypothetical protein
MVKAKYDVSSNYIETSTKSGQEKLDNIPLVIGCVIRPLIVRTLRITVTVVYHAVLTMPTEKIPFR